MDEMARPKKISDEALIADVDAYIAYTRKNDLIPNIIRFAQRNGLTRQTLHTRGKKNPELYDAIKRIVEEKEVVLEEGALTGKYAQTMAIFSLKQIGWRDKPDDVEEDDDNKNVGLIKMPTVELIGGEDE